MTRGMTRFIEWAEENWEAVGVAVSIAGALMLAVILLVVFNVVATRLDHIPGETVSAAPAVGDVQQMIAFTPDR